MNRSITSNDIESVFLKLLENKSPGPYGFIGEFYKTLSEELTPVFLKLFQKIAEEGTLLKSSCEGTWNQNQTKILHTQKKNYRPKSLMNIDVKILSKILLNQLQ